MGLPAGTNAKPGSKHEKEKRTKRKEGKGREGKGREGTGRDGKGREGKGGEERGGEGKGEVSADLGRKLCLESCLVLPMLLGDTRSSGHFTLQLSILLAHYHAVVALKCHQR